MLDAEYDVKTAAQMGGRRDAGIVLKHYPHTIEDITVTDAIFGTNLKQRVPSKYSTTQNTS